ncbi:MAG: 2-oxoglutarate oxidoreductase [Thermoanaerobacteraceae bacterium]|nr:2-oxoglutarate oxidoreductase [Thermoanaerobacteraceae bacterium]
MKEGAPVFKRPAGLTEIRTIYCPGCGHGIVHRLIAEVLEEMDLLPKSIAVVGTGCSGAAYDYFNMDAIHSAHGRAPAVASGVRRVRPDSVIFVYQGDGDIAAIGLGETVHAALRGENFTVVFANNALYGMTGGQAAPTTFEGITAKTPSNKFPLRLCEMLTAVDSVAYLARGSVHDPKSILATKEYIRKAFQTQLSGGYSMVEVLMPCPTNWRMNPVAAMNYLKETMVNFFPLGEFKMAGDNK